MKKESEKTIEKRFRERIEAEGGECLKLVTVHFAGLPDRLALLPKGRAFFAEIKGTGYKASKLQKIIMRQMERRGFPCYVIDHSSQIEQIVKDNLI